MIDKIGTDLSNNPMAHFLTAAIANPGGRKT